MAEFSVLVSLLALLGLSIGVLYPKLALFWYFGSRSRLNVVRFYLLLFVLSFIVFALTEGA